MLICPDIIMPVRRFQNILPRKLRKQDVSDYLTSRTFERKFGCEFPRRDFLLGLSASAALLSLPVRPARALNVGGILDVCKGTIECGLAALELLDEYYKVRKSISGQAEATNSDGRSESGAIILAIFDSDDAIEASDGRKYAIPRYTTAKFTFHQGPAPQRIRNQDLRCRVGDRRRYCRI